jgi:uncharacterized protein (TIGR03437 family)
VKFSPKSATVIALLVAHSSLCGQQYSISTYAGGVPQFTPILSLNASIQSPRGLSSDAAGNLYLSSDHCVFRLGLDGTLLRLAGNSRPGFSGEGGQALSAQLSSPGGVVVDSSGNLYVADESNSRVRRISAAGTITTVAGNGTQGYAGFTGPATSAWFSNPIAVAMDSTNNLYIADYGNNVVRKVTAAGNITTVAGNGTRGYSGDGNAAVSALLSLPYGIAVDGSGSLYIADNGNNAVRKVSPAGVITTIAGNGKKGFSGDGGPATAAQLNGPEGITLDSAGNLYIADTGNNSVRMISPAGTITTVAGTGDPGYAGDGGTALSSQLNGPESVTTDAAGNLYIADYGNNVVRKVSRSNIVTTLAGNGSFEYSGDGGSAMNAQLYRPTGITIDRAGNLYFVDGGNNVVRRISPTGIIAKFAGNGTIGYAGDGGSATAAQLNNAQGLAADSAGNLYIADYGNECIRRVSLDGVITTIAGNGKIGFSGDGGPSTSAQLAFPFGVAADLAGNLYISDTGNARIRRISPSGIITTIAGTGVSGHSGDSGPATNAALIGPGAITVDGAGNIYFLDGSYVRRISSAGIITTIAGIGISGYTGDGGAANRAEIGNSAGITVDNEQNVYITDSSTMRVRRVSSTGIISTIAGNGKIGYSGDGGSAVSAQLYFPNGIATDAIGNLYVADDLNNAIRLLEPILSSTAAITAVTNAASNLSGPISAGEMIVIYGSGLGPTTLNEFQLDSTGKVGVQLAGTAVSINGVPAPIIYSSSTQVAAIVPYEVMGTIGQVAVTYQGQSSSSFNTLINSAAPGLFTLDSTGKGLAALINQDGSINGPSHPAPIGSIVSLFATGEGQTSPMGVDGMLGQATAPHPLLPVTVVIGGQVVAPLYAGGAPGEIEGLMQINVQIPASISPSNSVSLAISVGGVSSQAGVTLAVSSR